MSTKIYDAYRLPSEITLNNLTEKVFSIKKDLVYEANKELLQRTIRKFVSVYDYCSITGKEKALELSDVYLNSSKNSTGEKSIVAADRGQLYKYMAEESYNFAFIRSEIIANRGAKASWAEIKASLLVIPYKDRLLAFVIGNPLLKDFLVNSLNLEDYHYQNQYDRPKEVSEEEWEERKLAWDEAIGPDYIPQNHGFIFKLVDPEGLDLDAVITKFKEDDVLSCIPTFEQRVKYLVSEKKVDPDIAEKQLRCATVLQDIILQNVNYTRKS